MSQKKIVQKTISYAELLKRVPMPQALQLKTVFDRNKRFRDKLYEFPEEPPKINWEFYKMNVRQEFVALVKEFEKKYNDYKVPLPQDPYTPKIEELKKQVEGEVEQYKGESNCRIQEIEEKIAAILDKIPYEDMTMEELFTECPNEAMDFINKPTFWPHDKEEQLPTPEEIAEKKRMEEELKAEEKRIKEAKLAAEEKLKEQAAKKPEEKGKETGKEKDKVEKAKDKPSEKSDKPEDKKK